MVFFTEPVNIECYRQTLIRTNNVIQVRSHQGQVMFVFTFKDGTAQLPGGNKITVTVSDDVRVHMGGIRNIFIQRNTLV